MECSRFCASRGYRDWASAVPANRANTEIKPIETHRERKEDEEPETAEVGGLRRPCGGAAGRNVFDPAGLCGRAAGGGNHRQAIRIRARPSHAEEGRTGHT